jgi:hypothetical protein
VEREFRLRVVQVMRVMQGDEASMRDRAGVFGAMALAMALLVGCADDDDATSGTLDTTSGTLDTTGAAQTESGTETEGADETGLQVVDYAADVQPIWNGSCTCHLQGPSGTMTATVLTLNAESSYDELVGAASEQVPGMDRVTPADLDGSYLWHKLQGTHMDVGGMGTSMPQGLMLGEEPMATVEAWIAGGAEP